MILTYRSPCIVHAMRSKMTRAQTKLSQAHVPASTPRKHREVQPSVPPPKASSHLRVRCGHPPQRLIRGCGIPRCDTAGPPIGESARPCLGLVWRPSLQERVRRTQTHVLFWKKSPSLVRDGA